MSLLIKKKLTQKEMKAVPHLLRNYHQLLISSNVTSFSEYIKYFINSTHYFLNQNKKNCLIIAKEKEILGIALLRFMEWDSNFFKMPIGCIEYILVDESKKKKEANKIERELLRNGIDLARELGMRILYISIESERQSIINTLNYLKFNFISAEMEGVAKKKDMAFLCKKEKLDSQYKFRKYKKDDYPQIIKIAKEINEDVNSKFGLTPYLPRKKKVNYYLESIKNCCLGLNADDIFVAIKNGLIIGFICYRYDRIFKKTLGRRISFAVIGGISRCERQKNIGSYFFTWAHKQIFKSSKAILGKAYLHNLPMIIFTLRRRLMPSFKFIYTFCKKL